MNVLFDNISIFLLTKEEHQAGGDLFREAVSAFWKEQRPPYSSPGKVLPHRKSEKYPIRQAKNIPQGSDNGSPEAWEIDVEPRGKPYFARHPEWSFSISDSGSLYACAFADRRLGLDLQLHSRRMSRDAAEDTKQQARAEDAGQQARAEDAGQQSRAEDAGQQASVEDTGCHLIGETQRLVRIARRFFHGREYRFVCGENEIDADACMHLPVQELYAVRDRFYQVWTAKEAYVKQTGQGIDGSFPKFCVIPDGGALPAFPLIAPRNNAQITPLKWEACGTDFYGLRLSPECSLCVCIVRRQSQ